MKVSRFIKLRVFLFIFSIKNYLRYKFVFTRLQKLKRYFKASLIYHNKFLNNTKVIIEYYILVIFNQSYIILQVKFFKNLRFFNDF